MAVIVAGPSSVGKTTYIDRVLVPRYEAEGRRYRLVFPREIPGLTPDDWTASRELVLHYNIVRRRRGAGAPDDPGPGPGAQGPSTRRRTGPAIPGHEVVVLSDFSGEGNLQEFLGRTEGSERRAILLVAGAELLLGQLQARRETESRGPGKGRRYHPDLWTRVYARVDLASMYLRFCEEMERWGVPYELCLVEADGGYELVNEGKDWLAANREWLDVRAMAAAAGGGGGAPASSEGGERRRSMRMIRRTMRRTKGRLTKGYRRLRRVTRRGRRKLRRGYMEFQTRRGRPPHSRMGDRNATSRTIFGGGRFEGRSVLDVGCAEGFFSFEAERSGAGRVVGWEKDEDRYRSALEAKAERSSDVEFVLGDVEDILELDDGSFDVVLLLNVLHHLADPIRVLRGLQAVAGECLVLEYATPDDPRFRRSSGLSRRRTRRLLGKPVIGVGSLTGEGQTLLLTDQAVRLLLMDHVELVEHIEFVDSPIQGRRIAFCWRRVKRG